MTQPDPLDDLRHRIGIPGDQACPKTGALGPGTFDDRQRTYAEEQRRLAEGGYDYGGREEWRAVMTQFGRR